MFKWLKEIGKKKRAEIALVTEDPINIKNINNPSTKLQRLAIYKDGKPVNWRLLEFIENQSLDIQIDSVTYDLGAYFLIKRPSKYIYSAVESVAQKVINEASEVINGKAFSSEVVDYEERCKRAVAVIEKLVLICRIPQLSKGIYASALGTFSNAWLPKGLIDAHAQLISFIPEVNRDLQGIAVKYNPNAIKYIGNPHESIQLSAVSIEPDRIADIKEPSADAQIIAFTKNPELIKFCKRDVLINAAKKDANLLNLIPDLTKEEVLELVASNGMLIDNLRHKINLPQNIDAYKGRILDISEVQYRELLIAALTENGDAIQFITSPDIELQKIAVTSKPSSIKFIEPQTREIQEFAVEQDISVVDYIRNPIGDVAWQARLVRELRKNDEKHASEVKTLEEDINRLASENCQLKEDLSTARNWVSYYQVRMNQAESRLKA